MRCIHRDLKEQLEHYRYSACVLWNFIMYRLTPPNRHHPTQWQPQVEHNNKKSKAIDFRLKYFLGLGLFFELSLHTWRINTFTLIFLTSCISFFSLLFSWKQTKIFIQWLGTEEINKTRSCLHQPPVFSLGKKNPWELHKTSTLPGACKSWEITCPITILAFTGSSRNYIYTQRVI